MMGSDLPLVQELREEVQVGDQGRLKDDRHVGSVEEFDGVFSLLTTKFGVLYGEVHTPTLEINNYQEDQNCREKIC